MPPAAPTFVMEPQPSGDASLDASDDWADGFADAPPRYCPTELLGSFTLLMAGHGRCVSSAMMLGDREYAMWQLARAHTLDDPQLRAIAARLFAWFDERHGAAPPPENAA
ncbi:hypothetical protein [Ramlibacter tataouinensis]|uniref:Uncharacterized protein n=1 Tax=Ramlibacter tataouinensis (strain ATCC BAA-407 / DSM 14655 / LMG 21543 / TTB310) TaxID=365046 RepID=F5XXZ4_RAMTT|nr:hypothetical protein [Ramlibacter tataouinensis]AEG94319.1 hypothetical protein Rta_32080 [Ramlibacter tataouinensis TTB310]